MFELMVTTHFEAAHCIPNYPGKCARLHGHNWTVEVCVGSKTLNELGMVMDFKLLKKDIGVVTERLDHHYLNEMDIWRETPPTAEHIAWYIFRELKDLLLSRGEKISLLHIKVWESQGSAALYREA